MLQPRSQNLVELPRWLNESALMFGGPQHPALPPEVYTWGCRLLRINVGMNVKPEYNVLRSDF